jgi:ADP-ribose pyrophosphatase YjhB (NUDIX family)
MSERDRREAGGLPKIGVGAVIWRGDELLLIRRAKPPLAGAWSIPGGHQELGETVMAALLREVREETALDVTILGLIDVVDAILRDEAGRLSFHYTLIDFSARWIGGTATAGGDAADLRWVRLAELPRFALLPDTQRIIEQSARLHGPLAKA